jgi:hypothetical protein
MITNENRELFGLIYLVKKSIRMGHGDRFVVPFAMFHWDKEPMSEPNHPTSTFWQSRTSVLPKYVLPLEWSPPYLEKKSRNFIEHYLPDGERSCNFFNIVLGIPILYNDRKIDYQKRLFHE